MKIRTLRELGSVVAGLNPKRLGSPQMSRLRSFAVITLKDVGRKIASVDALTTLEAAFDDVARFRAERGDVVVTTRGTDIRAAVAEEVHSGALVGANLALIRLRDSVLEPVLLAELLREPRTKARLLRDTAGASTPGFTIEVLGALPVCIPPIERQKALVEFIEAAAAHREALTRSIELRDLICSELISDELFPRGALRD